MVKRWFGSIGVLLLLVALTVGAVAAQNDEQQPFLGIGYDPEAADVVVTEVLPGSPAAEAGLEAGDVVTEVNGDAVTLETFADAIGSLAVGDEVVLTVERGDETLELNATLAARDELLAPAGAPGRMPGMMQEQLQHPFLGVSLEDTDDGVTIREVVPTSPAEAAGLAAGDIITQINGEEVAEARAAVERVQALAPGDTVSITTTRDGEETTVEVTLVAGSPREMRSFGLEGDAFAYNAQDEVWQVVALSDDSPLADAGLQVGDHITAVDGETLVPGALREYLDGVDADTVVTLSVERDGEEQLIDVPANALNVMVLPALPGMEGGDFLMPVHPGNMPFGGHMPFGGEMPFGGMMGMMGGGARLGVAFETLDADIAAEQALDVTEGALITEVADDSPAAAAELQVNDVVTAVDGDVVDAERTLRDRLFAYEPGDTVTLTILRDGETSDVSVTLDEQQMPMGEGMVPFGMMPFHGGRGQDGRGQGFQFEIPVPAPVPAEPAAPLT